MNTNGKPSHGWERSTDLDTEAGALRVDVLGESDSLLDWQSPPDDWRTSVWDAARTFYTVIALFDFEADRRGWAVTEIRFVRKRDGSVMAVLKARKARRNVVAFVYGGSFLAAFEELRDLKRTEGFTWYEDRYPPRTKD